MYRRARLRLTAWYAGVFLAVLLALGAGTFFAISRSLSDEVDNGIRSVVDGWVRDASPLDGLTPLDLEEGEFEGRTADVFVLIFRADGALVANPRNIEAEEFVEEGVLNALMRGERQWMTLREHGERFRVLAAPIGDGGTAVGVAGVVVAGRSLATYDRQVATIVSLLGVMAGAGLVLAVGAGYLLAGRALRPLEEAYERQRRFVGDASHELRSPLAVIRTNADVLAREHLAPAQHESVDQIREVSAEAGRLVDDLIALARLERRRRERAPAADLAPAVREAVEQMRPLLAAHGSEVALDLRPVAAALPPDDVRRIVRALLENVAAHTPPGTPAAVRVRREGDRAVVAVEDEGPGVPPEDLPALFDPLARADRVRTPGRGGGAGLGLSIVREIARAAGGEARASARPGGGLIVEVRLPARREAEAG